MTEKILTYSFGENWDGNHCVIEGKREKIHLIKVSENKIECKMRGASYKGPLEEVLPRIESKISESYCPEILFEDVVSAINAL